MRSYLTRGNVIGGCHSVRGGSTFCFVGEVKKGGRRSHSAGRRSTNDERNQYQGPHRVTPLALRFKLSCEGLKRPSTFGIAHFPTLSELARS